MLIYFKNSKPAYIFSRLLFIQPKANKQEYHKSSMQHGLQLCLVFFWFFSKTLMCCAPCDTTPTKLNQVQLNY